MVKTNQGSVIKAYKAIEALSNQPLPLPVSYKLFKLKKKLAPHFEFQETQELSLFDQYRPTFENGELIFASNEDRDQFIEKMKEVGSLEVEVDMEPEQMQMDENMKISISTIEALAEFITFE